MGSERQVEKLVSVFDLANCEALRLPEHVSPRIMLIYDKGEKIKEFRILTTSMSKEMTGRITSWLKENADMYDRIYELDMETANRG